MPRDDSNFTKIMRRIWRRRRARDAYRRFVESEDGKIILADLFRSTGVFADPVPLPVDVANFEAGKRWVVLRMMSAANMTEAEIERLAQEEYDEGLKDERLGDDEGY